MGQRSNVDNLGYLDTCTVAGTDSGLTAVSGTLDISLDLAKAQIISYFRTILGGHLSCVRSVLLRTAETHLSGRRPRYNLTLTVG